MIPNNCNPQRNRNEINYGRQPCSRFGFEGYFCIPREKCGIDGYTVDGAIDMVEVRTDITVLRNTFNRDFDASEYFCDSNADICCRNSSFYGKPEPVIRDLVEFQYVCEQHASFGYECVDEYECDYDGYTIVDTISGGLGIRKYKNVYTSSYASRMSCDSVSAIRQGFSSSLVCCRNSSFFGKPEPPGIQISINLL